MEKRIELFLKLHDLFSKSSFNLYMVGGTVRDYLLKLPLDDMDLVTDATPEEMESIIPDANYTFAKYGSVSYKIDDIKFDITTLRKEDTYSDSRHPLQIKFVKDLAIDVKRRDFTINALYMDAHLRVIDLVDGLKDIKNRILRMVGNPDDRLKEDPLRIIRAIRFALDYSLAIDSELDKAMRDNISLLNNLNPEKIKQDIKKIKTKDKNIIVQKFANYNIKHLVDVIE